MKNFINRALVAKKHLKLFFALFAMLALGVGNAWGAGTWTLVKDASTLSAGDKVVIVATDVAVAMSKTQNSNNRGEATVTKSDETLTLTDDVQELTLEVGTNSGTLAFNTGNGYLYAASSSKNYLRTETTLSDNSSWNITIANTGVATIKAIGSNTRNWLRYNNSSSIFACYGSGQGDVCLYKYVEEQGGDEGGGETPDPTQLTTPANLKEASITETSATLSWNAVANASNYSVTINGNTETVTTNSYSATGLTAGTEYTWSVIAKGDGTNYTDSDAAQHTFTTTATTPEPGTGTGGEETWTLVTNASDLKAGDQIVIAAKDYNYAISTTQNNNNRGQAAITKSGNNITFDSDVQILTLEAGTKSSTFGLNTGSGYLYASSSSSNQLKTQDANNDNGSWSISISSGTATIKANGTNSRNVMQYNQSSSLFACYGSASQKALAIYKKVTSSGETPETPTPSVSVAPTSHTFATTNVGETATQEFTITAENTTATLSASIDDDTNYAVSAVAGNKVTVTYQPQAAGTHPAVLTVKAGEEASATVSLSGKGVQSLDGTWILVTDASSLTVGSEIIIAAKESDYALSTTQNDNNRGQVEVTKTDNTITATTEAQVLTLQAGTKEGTLALSTGDGYLYAASSGSNYLRTETNLSDNSSWSVAVAADGTATLTAQGSNTRNTLFHNSSSKIFSCYASSTTTQKAIAIYKNTNGQQLAGLAYATTKYLTKLGDAFTTPTLTNPNSLTVTYSSSDDNVATVDNTGTVTIKAAGVVTITASFAGNSSFLEGSASYTIGVTEHAGTQADPYSVADARRVIDVMETAEGVYAKGLVSEIVTDYNEQYGNISYNISADGLTTSDQLQAYRGKSYDGANFTSADDVKVGDEVVIKGTLKKFSTTYEFDENNQLVSLNRTKEQAGLAYAETEHNANVGEDFAEPALTNPNNLTVTYSSSNTTLATVNATTGEVTILAAGKVTITASSAADATYAAGSASYNITITDPSLAVAQLPFTYNSGKADIETTAGITQEGLGSDYTSAGSPKLKFDHTGDNIVICFGSQADELSYDIKGNPSQGTFSCTFAVQESDDGSTYTDLVTYTTLETTTTNKTHKLDPESRYVKFVFTEKSNGNVALGNISITKPDLRAEAGIAWNPATVSLTVGDAFTAPTFNNPNGLSGITFASSNEALATVNNVGAITLISGKTGTATITATFADGHAEYKPAEVTCVITVSPKSEKVVILAEYNGQWYALKNVEQTAGKVLAALPVNYVGGKLYNVADADKATIEWQLAIDGTVATFKNGENYIFGTAGDTNLKLSTTECEWTFDGTTYMLGNRTFLYRAEANGFKNYNAEDNAGTDDYSELPVVTAPEYATGDAYGRTVTTGEYGTICIPYGSSNYTGVEFYEISWMEMDGANPKSIWLDQVNGALTAGKPYIFKATADEMAIVGDGTTAATPVEGVAGLTGTFTLIQDIETSDPSNTLEGNYLISGNQFLLCPAGCWLNANRAYIDASIIAGHTTKKAEIPGRRRVCLGETSENEATGFENIVAPEGQAVKAIVNGQLIIIRDGVKYNVQGQRL